jgi:hypothetical protein
MVYDFFIKIDKFWQINVTEILQLHFHKKLSFNNFIIINKLQV